MSARGQSTAGVFIFTCFDFAQCDIILAMQNEVVIEERKTSHGIILLSIVAVVLISIVYVQYKKTTRWLTNVTKEEVQETKDALLGKSSFSPITNTPMKTASESTLPNDIALLIGSNPINLLIKEAVGENKKPVYRITFVVGDELATFHSQTVARMRGSKQWEISRSERADIFSLIEAENETYQARISATYLADEVTSILIEIQSQ